MKRAGRLHAPELAVLVAHTYGHTYGHTHGHTRGERPIIELRAPSPGVFVPWIAQGDLVGPGAAIGELAVLGRISALVVPRAAGDVAATGIALELPPATHAVGYADLLVALDPSLQRAAGARGEGSAAVQATALGLVFRAPTSGRFYGRSTPDKPPFVAEGTQLTAGTTICLLEVMKTFHRVTYGGPGLPETAQVRRVLVADGDDVNAGDPLLALA